MGKYSPRLISKLLLNIKRNVIRRLILPVIEWIYVSGISLPPAIITDVDETILDNSPYAVNRSKIGLDYEPVSWFEWTDKAMAREVPGAGDFLRYAASKGVEIFYITNRDARERNSTIMNLKKLNLPNADSIHVLTKQGSSAKEPRRKEVLRSHDLCFSWR